MKFYLIKTNKKRRMKRKLKFKNLEKKREVTIKSNLCPLTQKIYQKSFQEEYLFILEIKSNFISLK